jgi:uncharacterized protein (TIGR02594 family)
MSQHVQTWQRAIGVNDDGVFGPATLKASLALLPKPQELPWITAGMAVMGLHERRDNARLAAWLRGGKYLGDPKALPWCGDFVETAIVNSLPGETFPGAVGENPFFARNWRTFGVPTDPTYGAVAVFERGPNAGHVGFLMGQNGGDFIVFGGNQGDSVSMVPIAKARFLTARWPATFPPRPINLPRMTVSAARSTNEA